VLKTRIDQDACTRRAAQAEQVARDKKNVTDPEGAVELLQDIC